MGKFNVVQKQRRRAIAEQKRAKHGDPITNKLSHKSNPNHPLHSISGKRKRKLFKKWRRDHKEAVEKGITMQDVEMAVADDGDDGTSQVASKQRPPPPIKFPIKRTPKLKARHCITRDKKKKKKKRKADDGVAEASSTSAMEE